MKYNKRRLFEMMGLVDSSFYYDYENGNPEFHTELTEDSSLWYHGTPDVRDVRATGFVNKTEVVYYIENPDEWKQLQDDMAKARNTDRALYLKLMDKGREFVKYKTIKKPIFLTSVYKVATTYAKDKKAFDYQNSIPTTLRIKVLDPGKVLRIDVKGDKFRGIKIDKVKQALVDNGISINEINIAFDMFLYYNSSPEMSTDDLSAIAQHFGFDTIDVVGVLDSYQKGTTKSTVRMIFDPERIKIV